MGNLFHLFFFCSGALEDFNKEDKKTTGASSGEGQHDDPPTEQLWNEEFIK